MKPKNLRVHCKNEEEYINLQLKAFKMGYWWQNGGTEIYMPKNKIRWQNGVTVIMYGNGRLLYSSSRKSDRSISYREWVNSYDESEKQKIVKFVNELFE